MHDAETAEQRSPRRRLKHGLDRTVRLFGEAIAGFSHHKGTQFAAALSYYGLFSIFPAGIVAAASTGFFLDDAEARAGVVDFLLEELPLSEQDGRSDIDSILDGVARNSGTIGTIGVIGLLIAASALMGSVRNALNVIFGENVARGALRGKALDILLILTIGLLLALSFGATLLGQLDIVLTGRVGDLIDTMLGATRGLLPVALSAAVFAVMLMRLPVRRRRLRDVWPGVLFATLGYELLKRAFSFYLDRFADYSAVYGSLGAVIAFMFFVYLAGIVFLLGAEMAAAWPDVRAGRRDPDPDQPGDSFGAQVRELVRGLFIRKEREPERREPGP